MRTALFILLSLILAESTGWGQSVPQDLDARSFNEKMRQVPTKAVLDVRITRKVAGGTLPGAVHIDFFTPDFASQVGRLDKMNPVFVYCAGGGRSGKATQQLQQASFRTVYNLSGGKPA